MYSVYIRDRQSELEREIILVSIKKRFSIRSNSPIKTPLLPADMEGQDTLGELNTLFQQTKRIDRLCQSGQMWYFWKVLAANILTKVAQTFVDLLGYF